MVAYAPLSRPDRFRNRRGFWFLDNLASLMALSRGAQLLKTSNSSPNGAYLAARPEHTDVVRVHSFEVQLGGLYLQARMGGSLACQPIVFDFCGQFPTCCVRVATVRSAHARTVHLMLWDSVPWVLRPGNRASIAICQVEPDRFPKHILMVRFVCSHCFLRS